MSPQMTVATEIQRRRLLSRRAPLRRLTPPLYRRLAIPKANRPKPDVG